jgi:uncharacterized protein YbaR (Trm112 family)
MHDVIPKQLLYNRMQKQEFMIKEQIPPLEPDKNQNKLKGI